MRVPVVIAVVSVAGCGSSTAPVSPAPPTPAPRTTEVPMSEPAEYDIDHASSEAGKAIFTRTGIGDPYKTGTRRARRSLPASICTTRPDPASLSAATRFLPTSAPMRAR